MKENIIACLLLLALISCQSNKTVLDYVDPFVGTGFHGHTYPGATFPFGAVQLSPDTRQYNWDACSGYHYSDSVILGFSHTHLSGTGCIDLGDILFYPSNEELKKDETGYVLEPIPFSHKNEKAAAGYYQVELGNGVDVQLTATSHTGIHQYNFPKDGKPQIVIDMAHLLDHENIKEAELNISSDEISGMRSTDGWVANQQVFFVAKFSLPYKARLVAEGKDVLDSESSVNGENLQAIVDFSGNQEKTVVCKVGISSVSYSNARENLEAEARDFNFDKIKAATQKTWEQELDKYYVSGGSLTAKKNFYSALYHCMVAPNIISDVNNEYRGADMKTRNADGHKIYSTFSLWDTFRSWNPLMTLTDTTLVNDMINSFLNFYDQTGELPVWPLSSGETGTMIGYHAVSVIYDAYSKNIRNYDVEKAFEAMKASAIKSKKGTTPYLEYGFIPSDLKRESVARLLENSYDDWCITEMARDLGHDEDYNTFLKRAQFYKNVFDGDSKFFRPRMHDGVWESPFIPEEVGRAYTEATAWQYRFFVPQDINGLINLFGNQQNFLNGLDSLFHTKVKLKGSLSDITGLIGQYAHGNEPSHHMAYLYSFAGQPWKTQEMVRRILTEMYQPTPEGISGNEDCGQMSAWFVMSSLGLYEVCPGSGQFVLTSPLFPEVGIQLANGKTLSIKANNPDQNKYIKEVYMNGELIPENYITYDRLMEGGELKFVLVSEPDTERGIAQGTFPYSLSQHQKEVSVPFVLNDISFFDDEIKVHCGTSTDSARIYYTLDGSEPDENSRHYTEPFLVNKSCKIKLKAYRIGYKPSVTSDYFASKVDYVKPVSASFKEHGVNYRYYEGEFSRAAEVEKHGVYKSKGICDVPELSMAAVPDHYGFVYSGFIYAPVKGVYSFLLKSDDGSVFFIGDQLLVDNDGSHAAIKVGARIALEKGFYPYKLIYFEDYEGEEVVLSWIKPGEDKDVPVTAENFYRE